MAAPWSWTAWARRESPSMSPSSLMLMNTGPPERSLITQPPTMISPAPPAARSR